MLCKGCGKKEAKEGRKTCGLKACVKKCLSMAAKKSLHGKIAKRERKVFVRGGLM